MFLDVSEDSKKIFLLTFRYFMTPQELFSLLVERFTFVPSDSKLSGKDKQRSISKSNSEWRNQNQDAIQLLVLVFLKNWIDAFFALDFWGDKVLYERLLQFCEKEVKESAQVKWSSAIQEQIETKVNRQDMK